MTGLMTLIAIVAVGGPPDIADLEEAFREGGVTRFLSAVHEFEQKRGAERTARTLVGLLSAHDRGIEAAAAHALGRMGEPGKVLLPELVKAIDDGGFPTDVLSDLGAGDIPLWLAEAMLDANHPSYGDAGYVLAVYFDLHNEKRLLPLLTRGLRHADPDVRYWAASALGYMGGTAAPVRALLVDILTKESPGDASQNDVANWSRVRGAAARALGQIGSEPDATARLLARMLKHPAPEVWEWSAAGLGAMEEKAAPAIPALVEALARSHEPFPGMHPSHPAAAALCRIGEPAIPALAGALQSKQRLVRQRAAEALLWMYKKKAALGALIKAAVEDEDDEVRLIATRALRFPPGFDRDEGLILPALSRIVKDKNPKVRAEAARVLGGLKSAAAVPSRPFVELLSDSDAQVRLAAVEAFIYLPRHKEIAPAVERLLNDPDESVRTTAKKLLKRLRE